MKKKIILSLLALVFCLPMMFAVTACGGDGGQNILSITATAPNKYYVGQDFKAGNPTVVVNFDDGTSKEVTDYTVKSYFNLTAGMKTVTIAYQGKETTIGIEVLSYDDYANYVASKLNAHIMQTSNIPTIDPAEEPTAMLDFSISNAAVYKVTDTSKSLSCANNGSIWYCNFDYVGNTNPRTFWFDFATLTLYTKSVVVSPTKTETTYTKEYFDTDYEAMQKLDELYSDMDEANTLISNSVFNPSVSFVDLVDTVTTGFEGINSQDGILELNYEGVTVKINMSNWTIRSCIPTAGTQYEFNCGVEIPELPNVDWKLASAE